MLADDQRNIIEHSNTQFGPGYNFSGLGLKIVRQKSVIPDQFRNNLSRTHSVSSKGYFSEEVSFIFLKL